jgi:spore coat polysaccharide biosynthesis protein SpsF
VTNGRTAILVTARLKSVRLPRKVLLPILGRPMLVHMLHRLKLAERAEEIIVCTSTVALDDPLEVIAREEGVACFRGDPEDVLLRMRDAARAFDVDTIVSCTADNPFVDPKYIDRLVDFHNAQGNEFSRSEGLPWGTFSYALSRGALERACVIKANADTEVWGGYFTQTGLFRWSTLEVTDPAVRWPELRLTVDTPADFKLVTRIFGELNEGSRIFPLSEIVTLCRMHPELVEINRGAEQKRPLPIRLKAGVKGGGCDE